MSPQRTKEFKTFLSAAEMERFEAFLEARGAKKGPYTRQLILRAMAADDTRERVEVTPSEKGGAA